MSIYSSLRCSPPPLLIPNDKVRSTLRDLKYRDADFDTRNISFHGKFQSVPQ